MQDQADPVNLDVTLRSARIAAGECAAVARQPIRADPRIRFVPTLLEVIGNLHDIPTGDGYTAGPTIFAVRPWLPSANAVVLR
ncbi:hypothetical protein [Actinoplanes sp. NPDC026623]|uniref:hypothetical protein n=1 Tax=Actinoplanes sp. NPDC026623 TaxID=3155610 RepID=UPI0033C2FA9C